MKQIKLLITIRLLNILFGIESKVTRKFINYIEYLRTNNGLPYTIKYMKSVRLHITRYICGQPLLVNKDLVSLTKGFPTRFLFLKDIIDTNNLIKIRGIMTLLYFTRSIIPTKEEEKKVIPDLSSITDKYKGKDYSIPMYFINN
jgi:hypothetical protein